MICQVGTADNIPIMEDLYSNTALVPLSTFVSHNPNTIFESGATGTFVTSLDARHLLDTSVVHDGIQANQCWFLAQLNEVEWQEGLTQLEHSPLFEESQL
jgi:hypothetical protein